MEKRVFQFVSNVFFQSVVSMKLSSAVIAMSKNYRIWDLVTFGPSIARDISPLGSPTKGGMVALKTRRREVPGSNPSRACRSSRSGFSVFFFFRNSHNYGLGSLKKTPTEGIPPIGPGPTSGQLALHLHPTNQPNATRFDVFTKSDFDVTLSRNCTPRERNWLKQQNAFSWVHFGCCNQKF